MIFFKKDENVGNGYKFAAIERGDIVNTVSSTGELEPIGTVEIGTQVSGTIDTVYVDFNDRVKRGQLIAVLDTTVLSTHCKDARNTVSRTKAQYDLSKIEYESEKSLFERGLTSEYKVDVAKTTMQSNRALYSSALTSLERAEQNLEYALIESPIDGMIIDRAVDPGQTVAASFSSPTLFIIAQDLSRMRILANVDESDIGLIDTGMTTRFEVPAYPDSIFKGRVTQVRLQPEVVSNVVNYTVVIEADNPGSILMPGMTATVDFLLEEKRDVLMVSNSALSFMPSQDILMAMREKMMKRRPPQNEIQSSDTSKPEEKTDSLQSDTLKTTLRENQETNSLNGMQRQRPKDMVILWVLDENADLKPIPVKKGVSDGINTEIIPLHEDVPVGTEIILSMPQPEEKKTNNNPFMPGRPRR